MQGLVLHYDHALRTYVINRIYGGSSEPSPWFLCFLASEPSVLQRCQASKDGVVWSVKSGGGGAGTIGQARRPHAEPLSCPQPQSINLSNL